MSSIFVATTSFGKFGEDPLGVFRKLGITVIENPLHRSLSPNEIPSLLSGCVGVIAGTESYSRAVLSQLPGLKVISRCGAGVDSIDLEAAKEFNVSVLNTPLGPTEAVAELTLGMILNAVRSIHSSTMSIRAGRWEKQMGFLMRERVVGIVGVGRVGKRLAHLLNSLGSRVIGFDKNMDFAWCQALSVSPVSLDQLLAESDIVCLHLPFDKTLYHVFGEMEFHKMKKGSFLVNTSRGGLVDEEALARVIKEGHLAGAALDVFEREPYTGPLVSMPEVILTPHIGSYARAGRIAMEKEAAQNLYGELQRRDLLPPVRSREIGRDL